MTSNQVVQYFSSVRRIVNNIRKSRDLETQGLLLAESTYQHCFVIPSYSEPINILRKTLEKLSQHASATSNYLIVLAMEESELGSEIKAQTLSNEFKHLFKDILLTFHPVNIPGEARGKASNVNWAVRKTCGILSKRGTPLKQIMLTIIDADASVPELYISTLEKAIVDTHEPLNSIFCPATFFGRNSLNIPALVRCTDIAWSIMHTQNLSNPRGIFFPCSAYSLSMVLADKVNYWDCDFDSIGEDFHMMLKCFYKSDSKAVSLDCPLNYANTQSTGYFSTIGARFTQGRRHALACADVGYALRRTLETPESATLSNIRDRVLMSLRVCETFIVQATSGWVFTLGGLMFAMLHITFEDPLFHFLSKIVAVLSILAPLPLLICCFIYEFYHRFLERTLFKKDKDLKGEESPKTRSLIHLLDYICLPISAFFYVTVVYTIACVQRLIPNNGLTYITSEKNCNLDD
ncbi:hypothetical protein HK099_000656 [Clydaea vesicula]|uniref:Glycosyltransferase 2-like domain-containing protein n=1 Tax=Clydaea vesicula TaxID=447962 RepID=A0AAD5XXE9_9FUNG|nr:hypothetical protein HK099_000656 [Clydaea vesicula]